MSSFRAGLAGLALSLAVPATAETVGPVDVDAKLVLAVDASRSMDVAEFQLQRDGYTAALRHPDLARAIGAGVHGRVAIAYFEWSGAAQDGHLVPWRVIDGREAAATLADEIAALPVRRSRGTSISRALAFATTLLEDDLIVASRNIVDISGDGANNTGPPVLEARDAAIARGITINGLPIMAFGGAALSDLDLYYEACVIGGPGAFVMVANDTASLAATIRRKLVVEVSGIAPPARVVAARIVPARAGPAPDCLIGEKMYRQRDWSR